MYTSIITQKRTGPKNEEDNYQKNVGEKYRRTHLFCETNLDGVEVEAENGNETPDAKREKKACIEKKIWKIHSCKLHINYVNDQMCWQRGMKDKQEICPKKGIIGFHQ